MSLPTQFETRASGKLLLTGEYFVLDGATALALPVRYGQRLEVSPARPSGLFAWNSRDENGKPWFSVEYELPYLSVLETSDRSIAEMLASMIRECQRQNPSFLSVLRDSKSIRRVIFRASRGLGTSSTLIQPSPNGPA
jgi:mevalonate kinase